MATPKVYVICDANCKFEGMTKEQILTAIMQAVNEGAVGNIDAGFITTIKTINGLPLKFFVGEQAAYDALTDEQKENLFALITNDASRDGIMTAIEDLQAAVKANSDALAMIAGHAGQKFPLSATATVTDGKATISTALSSGIYLILLDWNNSGSITTGVGYIGANAGAGNEYYIAMGAKRLYIYENSPSGYSAELAYISNYPDNAASGTPCTDNGTLNFYKMGAI